MGDSRFYAKVEAIAEPAAQTRTARTADEVARQFDTAEARLGELLV